jgi:cytoskeletal protein RodZ
MIWYLLLKILTVVHIQGNNVSILSTEQEEKLREIGTYLCQLRKQKSVSLDEVAAHTYIRASLLRALEEAKEESLPEPVYIQGFIRRYADSLGLDGNALAMTFPIELPPIDLSEQLLDAEVIGGKKHDTNNDVDREREPGSTILQKFQIPSLPEKISFSSIPYLPYVLAAAAVAIGGVFYLMNRPKIVEYAGNNKPSPTVEQKQTVNPAIVSTQPTNSPPNSTPSPIPQAANSATPQPTISTPSPTPESTTPLQVNAQFQEDSWIRVTVDRKVIFEGILPKGKQESWTAKERIVIRAGNAGAVLVSVNNEQAKTLGEAGKVAEVTFTPQR